MSVNILYCEGGKNSPDIRVLLNILSGVLCTVTPAGSKYGLDRQILFIKQKKLLPGSVVAALKDRDFDNDESLPVNSPRNWFAKDDQSNDIQVGWSWERKEIENYLIDPEVVSRALGSKAPPIEDYRAALEESAKNIADYTAARIALSLSRQRLPPLNNCWGNIGSQHTFPDCLAESDCRTGITDIVRQYEQAQIIRENDVLNSFDQLLPVCRVGGIRFENFLTFFSGKDLLCGMRSKLMDWELGEPFVFRARIVNGIETSTENVSSWIPEWSQLKQVVQNFSP